MKPEAQRIAIAEACPEAFRVIGGKTYWKNDDGLCDILSDLNAMAVAVQTLTDDQYNDADGFTYKLAIACGYTPEHGFDFRPMQEATAAQRAEAFLRTINKWVEE